MVGIVEFHIGGRTLRPAPCTGSNAMSDLSHRRVRDLSSRATGLRAALLASAFTVAGALAADAAEGETQIGVNAQTGVAVTIYNQDLALVKDRRTVPLVTGSNRLAFIDVSARIRPETALLNSSEGRLDVLEQNFDFDLLTPEKLLEKSVGGTVRLITTNPETGAETVEEATVLSVTGGVVLRVGDRIETAPAGRIVFSEVPANLRARPTLVVELDNDAPAGDRPVELMVIGSTVEDPEMFTSDPPCAPAGIAASMPMATAPTVTTATLVRRKKRINGALLHRSLRGDGAHGTEGTWRRAVIRVNER